MGRYVLQLSLGTILLISLVTMTLGVPDESPHANMRGHRKPFGHHAHQWLRVKTTYDEGNPEPKDFYKDYVKKSIPLVMRGAIKNAPAIQKWKNLSYIAEISGDNLLFVGARGIFPYDKYHAFKTGITMEEYIQIYDKEPLYMDSPPTPEIQKDLEWPHSVDCDEFAKTSKTPALFFNHGKSNTDIHIDGVETLFMQVRSSRLWIIAPPEDVNNLYGGRFPHHSGVIEVDQRDVDYDKFPNVSKATIYAAMVHPGDIIYVPEAWYHNVIAVGSPNIALTVFFDMTKCESRYTKLADYDYIPTCIKYKKTELPDEIECKEPIPRGSSYYDVFTKYKNENPQLHYSHGTYAKFEKESNKRRKVLNTGQKLKRIGYSVTGMTPEALKEGKILKLSLRIGHRVFLTSPGDGSEEALARAIKESNTKREDVFIIATIPTERFGKDSARKSMEESLKNLNTDYLDLVLMRVPYGSREHDSAEGLDRFLLDDQWLATWQVMEEFKTAKKVIGLGLQDVSFGEANHLIEKVKANISVIYARLDPFYRNKKLRTLALEDKIQFMAHSTHGDKWVEEGYFKVNPLILNEEIQAHAYGTGSPISSVMNTWAMKRNALVITAPTDQHMKLRLDFDTVLLSFDKDNEEIYETIDGLSSEGHPQKES